MKKRIVAIAGVGILISTAIALAFLAPASNTAAPQQAAADKLKPLHLEKMKPAGNDWLATHKEPGQTFAQYQASKPNRPTRERTTVYVQPIGEFTPAQQKLVAATSDLLSRFYNVPTKTLERLPLDVIPAEAQRIHPNWGDRQILTTYVLDKVLKPHRPKDAVAVLALTSSDLWPGEGWNFVFGQASLQERVGVWSIYRYGNLEGTKDEQHLFKIRTFKVALHETGHMLGIHHCIHYECGMNGSNHLEETDRAPLWFCPQDEQKIWWATNADPAKRYEQLIDFADKHEMPSHAKFWRESLQAIKQNSGG